MPDYTIEPSWDMKAQQEVWEWSCDECEASGSESNATAAESAAQSHVREVHGHIH